MRSAGPCPSDWENDSNPKNRIRARKVTASTANSDNAPVAGDADQRQRQPADQDAGHRRAIERTNLRNPEMRQQVAEQHRRSVDIAIVVIELGVGGRARDHRLEDRTGIGVGSEPGEAGNDGRQGKPGAIATLVDCHGGDQAVVPLMAADRRRTLLVRIFDQLTGAERRGDLCLRERHVAVERWNAGDQEQGEYDRASQH